MIKLLRSSVIFFLCFSFSVFAGGSENHKRTFVQKDPFQSSVFLQNNGIFQDYDGRHILYYADHDHLNVYFTEQGLIYRVSDIDKHKLKEITKEKGKKEEKEEEPAGIPVNTSTVVMNWVGANPHPAIIASEQAEGYHTYFKKSDTGYSTLESHGYKTLIYKDIYPGIDIVYNFPDKGGIKYDLIVHPGADPAQIVMKYSGAVKNIRKDADGNIAINSLSGSIIEHTPVCFSSDHDPVASSFSVNGNSLRFQLAN